MALVAFFSTGLLIGCLTNFDTSCSTREISAEHSSSHSSVDAAKEEIFLIVLILSAKDYRDRRDSIRESWLRLGNGRRLKHFFVLGSLDMNDNEKEELEKENENHNDMLIFPQVKDSYSGLTHKLLAALRAVNNRYRTSYVAKFDDDSFVRLDSLFDELTQRKDASKLYWGYFVGGSPIKKSGQWTESKWFLCDRYLPYAVGGGYVISADLVNFIASNSHFLQLYVSEDVSLGTWLAPLEINREHDVRFDTWYKSRGCSNEFLVTHKQTPTTMRVKYLNLESSGKLCKNEKFSAGHSYNWSAIPSKCCGPRTP